MLWIDVVAVTLAAVLANHMGLIDAAERVVRHKLPVLNCAKCLTFWAVLVVLLCRYDIATYWTVIVATSFLAAYSATWLELLFGIIDKQYERLYEKTYPQEATEASAYSAHATNTTAEVSELREISEIKN